MKINETSFFLSRYFDFCYSLRTGVGVNIYQHPFQKLRKAHFDAWAKQNIAIFKEILPTELLLKISDGILDTESAQRISILVEKFLLEAFSIEGYSFYELLTLHRHKLPNSLQLLTKRTLKHKTVEVERLIKKGLGIILIRPEIFYLKDLVTEFLGKFGYEEVLASIKVLKPEHYFSLYNHVFDDQAKEAHVRRRAFGYINQKCWVLLLRNPSLSLEGIQLAVDLSERVKGVVCVEDVHTLRGGICFNEAQINQSDTDPCVRLALNPY
ncbi:MAG: hypothetical protein AAB484_00050, partial [Patescibacteria group bacterium]